MAGLYRQVYATFWSDPKVVDQFSPEDKFFYLYLLTNEHTNQCGIYPISLKQIAFDTGYSAETVKSLVDRFQTYLKRIRYNPETSELAILNWAKYNYPEKLSDNRLACIAEELSQVKDREAVRLVLSHAAEAIRQALAVEPAPDTTPSTSSADPSSIPLQAPSKPLRSPQGNKDNDKDNNKDKEGESAPARVSDGKLQYSKGPEPVLVGQEPEAPPHIKLSSYWFKRFNLITATTMLPDDRANLGAKKLLETLGGNLNLALKCVDYYFDTWPDLWFACKKETRNGPRETRQYEFRFGSFASPENIQEILSRMKASPAKTEPKRWSTGIVIDDSNLASAEERVEALEKIKSLAKSKKVVVAL